MMADDNFLKVAQMVRWMDEARWTWADKWWNNQFGDKNTKDLDPHQKILVHWLCYINDYQRNVSHLWDAGGTVFTKIVEKINEYNSGEEFLQTIRKHFRKEIKNKDKEKINPFKADGVPFGPRYRGALYGVLRTLYILKKDEYQGNLIKFIETTIDEKGDKNNPEKVMNNLSMQLYKLSYHNIGKAKSEGKEWRTALDDWWHDNKSIGPLIERFEKDWQEELSSGRKSDDNSEEEFWRLEKRYDGTKRLWASLRDYIEPQAPFHEDFVEAIEDNEIKRLFEKHEEEVAAWLEFPVDLQNEKFAKHVLIPIAENPTEMNIAERLRDRSKGDRRDLVYLQGNSKGEFKGDGTNMRKLLRFLYNFVRENHGNAMEGCYPAQMDVTFNFAPNMCDECKSKENYRVCPFSRGKDLSKMCIAECSREDNVYCPFLLYTCDYIHHCNPDNCPLYKLIKEQDTGLQICDVPSEN